ncbi:2-phosphosulfolactate phosphatase [Cyclobacteriaceae bacterium]|nr:2-phosphosulfolactate phosphatase [Cyclobacteriaceae bacterium]
MNTIDVCLSPDLIHLYDFEGKIAVVVDILRATSCMTTAFAHGIKEIVPVDDLEICADYGNQGFLTAAERNGQKVEGFNFGNSPFSYMTDAIKGKSLAVTTTNGTRAIELAKDRADEVIIGSFLNLTAVKDYCLKSSKDIVVVCAGWKGRVNLEDSLFAGALVKEIGYSLELDASKMSLALYEAAENDLAGLLDGCNHIKRLQKLNIQKDIEFCLELNKYDVVPYLDGKSLKV